MRSWQVGMTAEPHPTGLGAADAALKRARASTVVCGGTLRATAGNLPAASEIEIEEETAVEAAATRGNNGGERAITILRTSSSTMM